MTQTVSDKIDQYIQSHGGNARDALNIALAKIELIEELNRQRVMLEIESGESAERPAAAPAALSATVAAVVRAANDLFENVILPTPWAEYHDKFAEAITNVTPADLAAVTSALQAAGGAG